ncbi:imidazoleglycerol-phosphate dehydratase HisB [Sporosarcina sp. Te-1]|uniref:imidazoleglycerol-phosphate dehydratase HisB n=1 Tax=Sporosarcina sp. Te-1 TaxID=2818390 RepID=UPI001A9E5816|nr:imidazoleglycerol-phosphate dehydratase HisB [Sporosarcina sp. Te-1]QTD41306.1 imidazoleglycerol-phosphate dehydratase HisB [Sporosarcina sp. Te-1]
MRIERLARRTNETAVELELNLDGIGKTDIRTGVGFLDHMLTLFTKHGRFDLKVECVGDLEVDQHHSTEDVGIVLGQAFAMCIGTKEGIERYATVSTPMDEALSTVSVDISGRSFLVYRVEGLKDKVGDFDTELVEEFFLAFTRHAGITLHIQLEYGKNSHHMIESIYKGFGRALCLASAVNPQISGVPSTKGAL